MNEAPSLRWRLGVVGLVLLLQLPLVFRFWPAISAVLPIWAGIVGQALLVFLAIVVIAVAAAALVALFWKSAQRHA